MRMAELERELKDIDPRLRYHIIRQEERIISIENDLKTCATTLASVVDTLVNVHNVNVELNRRWENMRRGEPEGLVESVLNKPDTN